MIFLLCSALNLKRWRNYRAGGENHLVGIECYFSSRSAGRISGTPPATCGAPYLYVASAPFVIVEPQHRGAPMTPKPKGFGDLRPSEIPSFTHLQDSASSAT